MVFQSAEALVASTHKGGSRTTLVVAKLRSGRNLVAVQLDCSAGGDCKVRPFSRFGTLAAMETRPTDFAQNRVRLLKIEIAAHSEELRILRDDGRSFTEADRQHHRAMVRYFRSEIEAIRSQAPLSSWAPPGMSRVSADEDFFMT